jgi:hypothetical protein
MSAKCGWCGTRYETWQNKCGTCGGRMPPMPGMELGEEPPAIPRELPKGFAFRQRFTNSAASLFGLILMIMGGLMGLLLLLIKPWFALLPAMIFIGGALLLRHGMATAAATLRAFREGLPLQGRVLSSLKMTSQSHNGVNPWKLLYEFSLEGQKHQGSLIAWDENISQLKPRQPLWILYVREDPSINTVYPPFK